MIDETLKKLLDELTSTRFYGTLELKYAAGKVVLTKRTEITQYPSNYRSTRNEDGKAVPSGPHNPN